MSEALDEAVRTLATRGVPWAALREEALRTSIFAALDRRLPGHVRRERKLPIAGFRAGASDLLVDRQPGGAAVWAAETKWSYADPPKIFEAVWDAIKLCHQIRQHGLTRAWLITGASVRAWHKTESASLFEPGSVSTRMLWDERLDPPRGPNYGKCVGEDLVIGANGNQPTAVPHAINVELVSSVDLDGAEPWRVRTVAVTPRGEWIEDFAPPPRFPSPLTQAWLAQHVPAMDDATFQELLEYLRMKRWTVREIDDRIRPLRR